MDMPDLDLEPPERTCGINECCFACSLLSSILMFAAGAGFAYEFSQSANYNNFILIVPSAFGLIASLCLVVHFARKGHNPRAVGPAAVNPRQGPVMLGMRAIRPQGEDVDVERAQPLAARQDVERAQPLAARQDVERAQPLAARQDVERAQPLAARQDVERAQPLAARQDVERAQPLAARQDVERAQPLDSQPEEPAVSPEPSSVQLPKRFIPHLGTDALPEAAAPEPTYAEGKVSTSANVEISENLPSVDEVARREDAGKQAKEQSGYRDSSSGELEVEEGAVRLRKSSPVFSSPSP